MNLSKNLQPSFHNLPPRLIGGQAHLYGGRATTYHLKPSPHNLQPTTYNLQPSRGFTLIELLVVVGIISVVTGVVMASINSAKAKGRDAKRIADVSVIQLALERYYDDPTKKQYPASLGILDDSVPKIDPSGNNYSFFALTSDNDSSCSGITCQSYHLGATLELDNPILDDDADLDSGVSGDFDDADTAGCGGGTGKCYDVIPKF